jgi:hypothetical protein
MKANIIKYKRRPGMIYCKPEDREKKIIFIEAETESESNHLREWIDKNNELFNELTGIEIDFTSCLYPKIDDRH